MGRFNKYMDEENLGPKREEIEKGFKHKMKAAYHELSSKEIDAATAVDQHYANIKQGANYVNLDNVLDAKDEVLEIRKRKAALAEEYKELFDEDITKD